MTGFGSVVGTALLALALALDEGVGVAETRDDEEEAGVAENDGTLEDDTLFS